MRLIAILAALMLSACAAQTQLPPQTVTITKTVPVYPPDSLYSIAGPCAHSPDIESGTVRDLANALISERSAVDACLGDRASLREWRANVSTDGK